MKRRRAYIVDHEFSGSPAICSKSPPTPVEWVRVGEGDGGGGGVRPKVRFFTDRCLTRVNEPALDADIKVALLVEPRFGSANRYYEAARSPSFDCVLSYDAEYLTTISNGLPYQMGGCWVNPDAFLTRRRGNGFGKDELVNIIASNKAHTFPGYILRYEVARTFPDVPRYGSGFKLLASKEEALLPAYFSIVIENIKLDDWWTEKIVDCFACGTVPIYWGSPSIGKTFNPDGIITFDTLDELRGILGGLSKGLWQSKLPAIWDNLDRVQMFTSPEYQLLTRYPYLFPET